MNKIKSILTKIVLSIIALMLLTSSSYGQTQGDIDNECTDIKTNLRLRSWDNNQGGTEVTKLQKFLYNNRFLTINPTGFFDSKTKQAVSDYQRSVNLIGTGFVGPLTRGEIKKDTCNGNVSDNGLVNTSTAAQVTTQAVVNQPATATINAVVVPRRIITEFSPIRVLPFESTSLILITYGHGASPCQWYFIDLPSGNKSVEMTTRVSTFNPTANHYTDFVFRGSLYPSGAKAVVNCNGQTAEAVFTITTTVAIPEVTISFSSPSILSSEYGGFTVTSSRASVCKVAYVNLANGTRGPEATIPSLVSLNDKLEGSTKSIDGGIQGSKYPSGVKVVVTCSNMSGDTTAEATLNVIK